MEIPYEGRLGCKITIPNTSYRKIVKFEDGLSVDHLSKCHQNYKKWINPLLPTNNNSYVLSKFPL